MYEIPFDLGEIFKYALQTSFVIFLGTVGKFVYTKQKKKKARIGEFMAGAFFVTGMIGIFYLFATMKSGGASYDGIVFPIMYSAIVLMGLVLLGLGLSDEKNREKIRCYISWFWKVMSK